ncbi:signal peptidase II [Anthocerotibacter panamensis]|uniref:signal peptidase II n=1 Tax=Anthocerotibacter panamensis TaxID=2857077 RepID=UPI001C4051DA|nr:signal peptidase II [Anthocerotibacter panamensis]
MKNQALWVGAILVLALDRATKYWVMQTLPQGATVPLWPGVFHLTHVTNTGAAFSLLAGTGSTLLSWVSVVVSLGILGYGWLGPVLPAWERWGYGLILGGAMGNGLDRVLRGEVIDFLDLRLIQFPIFNGADIAINLGVACLLWANLRARQSSQA